MCCKLTIFNTLAGPAYLHQRSEQFQASGSQCMSSWRVSAIYSSCVCPCSKRGWLTMTHQPADRPCSRTEFALHPRNSYASVMGSSCRDILTGYLFEHICSAHDEISAPQLTGQSDWDPIRPNLADSWSELAWLASGRVIAEFLGEGEQVHPFLDVSTHGRTEKPMPGVCLAQSGFDRSHGDAGQFHCKFWSSCTLPPCISRFLLMLEHSPPVLASSAHVHAWA